MTDTLRDRIAAVLGPGNDDATAYRQADAVLEVLLNTASALHREQALRAAEEALVDYRRRRRERYRGANAVAMKDEHDTWINQAGTEVEAIVDSVLATVHPGAGDVVLDREDARLAADALRHLAMHHPEGAAHDWGVRRHALAERLETAT